MPVSESSTGSSARGSVAARSAILPKVRSTAERVRLLEVNHRRVGYSVYNNSNQALYLDYDSRVSDESFLVKLSPRTFFEPLVNCGDAVWGVWEAADTEGEAHIREYVAR